MVLTLDEAWFEKYRTITSMIGEAYELLEPSPEALAQRRREFEESGYRKNVSMISDRVDTAHFEKARNELSKLRAEIVSNEQDERVREAYLDAIDRSDANARLIVAGAHENSKEYADANAALYDLPDEKVFRTLCHWIRHTAEQSLHSENNKLPKLAERVLEVVPDLEDNHHYLIPTEEIFHRVRQIHRQKDGYYDLLWGSEGFPADPYIGQDEGDEICRRILRNIGSDFSIDISENNIWAVMSSRKSVVRPRDYRLDRDEFIGIVCHEIGSHVLEEVNGKNQPLRLLSLGLAGYEKGNEGRAFLREQIVYENERTFLEQFAWEYIILLHFSVSLAAGLYQKPYKFAELYDILFDVYMFWRERRLPHATNNEAFARNEAWYLTVRILKGTDGHGGAYLKDSVYLEGNIRCWQRAAEDPSIILLGDLGKFDITNDSHINLVRSLLNR